MRKDVPQDFWAQNCQCPMRQAQSEDHGARLMGLAEKQAGTRRWSVVGPIVARMLPGADMWKNVSGRAAPKPQ